MSDEWVEKRGTLEVTNQMKARLLATVALEDAEFIQQMVAENESLRAALDSLEREWEETRMERDLHREGERLNAETARKTYAQLLAAREVVEASKVYLTFGDNDAKNILLRALSHYDEATG